MSSESAESTLAARHCQFPPVHANPLAQAESNARPNGNNEIYWKGMR